MSELADHKQRSICDENFPTLFISAVLICEVSSSEWTKHHDYLLLLSSIIAERRGGKRVRRLHQVPQ